MRRRSAWSGFAGKEISGAEKPNRAVFTRLGENTCVSCRLKTCSRKVSRSVKKASNGVAVTLLLSSIV